MRSRQACYEGQPEASAVQTYFAAPEQWLRGDRSARIPGSIDGNEFDARFDEAVQQIYDSGDDNPVAYSHGAAIMLWVQMNVGNPNPQLLMQHPLDNTGYVVIKGNPTDGWTLTDWDGAGTLAADVTCRSQTPGMRRRSRLARTTAGRGYRVPRQSQMGAGLTRFRLLPYVTVEVDDRVRLRARRAGERLRVNLRAYLRSAADEVETASGTGPRPAATTR